MKLAFDVKHGNAQMINYNMRCIETIVKGACVVPCGMINYNMRCIETNHKEVLDLDKMDKLQHEMY